MATARTPGRVGLGLLACLTMAGSGCDVVQGYQDAGDALFPEQSTHLATPGLRLVRGHYTSLDGATGSEVFLLAREADDATEKLVSMRYADPHPCEIQRVSRFRTTRELRSSVPLIAYFQEDVSTGTLHFADARCQTFELTFEDARLPISETETSFVVWAGSDLWLATPEAGKKELLASGVTGYTSRVFGQRFAVRAEGRLALFDASWQPQGTFGAADVGSVLRAGQSFFYEDGAGVHRIVASSADSKVLESELLVEGACSLASQDGTWVTVRSPCAGGKLLAIHEPTGKVFTLPFDADASNVMLLPASKSPGLDPLVDPFWFLYLRSGETPESRDSLFLRTPAGEEHALGARSTLGHLRLVESETETHGYALIDIDGDTGRYIWWNAAGETRVLAERAMWRPDRLIVDPIGPLGNLAVASGDSLVVLAERVLWEAFEYRDDGRRWTVLFHDVQEDGLGQLSLLPSGIDALESTRVGRPLPDHTLAPVASSVIAFGTAPLDDVLPGVAYVTDFDPKTVTGRLEYRNLDLRFTARVNDGVAGYVLGHDEIIYTIPYGDNAGIWLASAK